MNYLPAAPFGLGLDAAFVRTSTGNEGTKGWGVLVGRRDGRWDLPLLRADEARIRVEADGSSVVRRQPVYLTDDPNCCPSGGTKVEVYDHNGGTFTLARSYTEGGAGGEPTDAGEQADGAAAGAGEGRSEEVGTDNLDSNEPPVDPEARDAFDDSACQQPVVPLSCSEGGEEP